MPVNSGVLTASFICMYSGKNENPRNPKIKPFMVDVKSAEDKA